MFRDMQAGKTGQFSFGLTPPNRTFDFPAKDHYNCHRVPGMPATAERLNQEDATCTMYGLR